MSVSKEKLLLVSVESSQAGAMLRHIFSPLVLLPFLQVLWLATFIKLVFNFFLPNCFAVSIIIITPGEPHLYLACHFQKIGLQFFPTKLFCQHFHDYTRWAWLSTHGSSLIPGVLSQSQVKIHNGFPLWDLGPPGDLFVDLGPQIFPKFPKFSGHTVSAPLSSCQDNFNTEVSFNCFAQW